MTFPQETALKILKRIAEIWQIEPARVRWVATNSSDLPGFDWWPGDFRVHVQAMPPPENVDFDGFRILVRTDFLKDVAIDTERFELVTAYMSRFSTSCYSWIYPPKALWDRSPSADSLPTLWLSGSAYINEANMGWMTELIANLCIIQPINAQLQSSAMTELLGCGIPDKTTPVRSATSHLDEILEVVAQVYAPLGQQPSRFANTGEFEDFASKYAQSDVCFGFGDQTSMTLETPFGNDSALISFHTSEKNPQLGHGLLTTLQLPWFNDKLVTAREVAELNLMEFMNWTEFPQLGCWHIGETRNGLEGVAFSLFIPNSLYKPGLATNVAFWFLNRVRWAREQKFPDMPDTIMLEILKRRFGDMRQGS